MNLTTIRTELEAWVRAVTGLEVYWRGRPLGWLGPTPTVGDAQAHVLLLLSGPVGRGEDSLTWSYDDDADVGEEMTPRQRGLRELTLELQVRSFSANDGEDAIEYIELLRDSTRLPAAEAAFDAAGLGLQAVLQARPLSPPMEAGGRELSCAVLELRFNAIADRSAAPIGFVTTFDMLGEAIGPDGSTETIIDGLVPD